MQLRIGNILRAHLIEIALNQNARLLHILRIAAVEDGVSGARLGGVEADIDGVDVAGDLAQIVIKARGVEAAAEDVVAKLERVVVGVEAVELELFGEGHGILHRFLIGNRSG